MLSNLIGDGCVYKLLSISESEITRYVKLQNCETGEEEYCFDDSDVRYDCQDDFAFMTIGNVYECKILLFDCRIISAKLPNHSCIECRIVNNNLSIGNLAVIQIESNGNTYYIAKRDIMHYPKNSKLFLAYSRKDLIQVNGVVAPRLLR